jgi:hypothetical protein
MGQIVGQFRLERREELRDPHEQQHGARISRIPTRSEAPVADIDWTRRRKADKAPFPDAHPRERLDAGHARP